MKCSDKWLRQQIKQKAKSARWITELVEAVRSDFVRKGCTREQFDAVNDAKYMDISYVLGLLDEREAELRENIRCQTSCSTLTNCCRDTKIRTYKEILAVDE